MTRKTRRERIRAARDLLDLGESATIAEIKKAYRDKAKENHPDTAGPDNPGEISMARLTEAYETLIDYCQDSDRTTPAVVIRFACRTSYRPNIRHASDCRARREIAFVLRRLPVRGDTSVRTA